MAAKGAAAKAKEIIMPSTEQLIRTADAMLAANNALLAGVNQFLDRFVTDNSNPTEDVYNDSHPPKPTCQIDLGPDSRPPRRPIAFRRKFDESTVVPPGSYAPPFAGPIGQN